MEREKKKFTTQYCLISWYGADCSMHSSSYKQRPGKNMNKAYHSYTRHCAGLPKRGAESHRPSPLHTKHDSAFCSQWPLAPLPPWLGPTYRKKDSFSLPTGHTVCALLLEHRAEGYGGWMIPYHLTQENARFIHCIYFKSVIFLTCRLQPLPEEPGTIKLDRFP